MKKFVYVIILALLVSSFPMQVMAYDGDEIMPLYENINAVYACLSIDESLGIASCTGRITAKGIHPVSVDVILQIYENNDWDTLASWSATDTWSITCMEEHAVYSGYEYRVLVYGYVYDANGKIIESGSAVHEVNYPKQ